MSNLLSKTILLLHIILFINSSYAQVKPYNKRTQLGFTQLDFQSIKMPEGEENMDFTGIHYNVMVNKWGYVGLGIYGSVGGQRGGFFTLGLNAGIKKNITNKLFLETGLHFGGGGGASAPDGGGAFILPHANIGYSFKQFSITTGWNYINFFDGGTITSNQANIAIQIPISYNYASFAIHENQYSIADLTKSDWNQRSKKISLLVHFNNLYAENKSQFTDGTSIKGKTIRLAGFELNSYFKKNLFAFIRADGAYNGIPAGYMDVILGAGYHLSLNKNRTNILAKFGIGAGGGGGVDTKGGFLIYPDLSIEQKLLGGLYATLNKGYLMTPDAFFKSSTFGIGIKYYVEQGGTLSDGKQFKKGIFKGLETILKQDMYLDANRNGSFTQNLYLISMQVNLSLNKYIYTSGQTSFANFGNAGAYAEGIVGLGAQTDNFLSDKISAFVQLLGGAAGGGGISTGEGLIIKPSLGLNYKLNDKLKIRGSLGQIKAYEGNLNSTFINLGMNYNFSIVSVK